MVTLRKAANGNINTRHGEDAGRSFPHVGIDIGWGGGTELYAPAAGWITWAWVGTYGIRCIIVHDDDTWSLIAHADEFFGENGRRVEDGEHMGTMGRTGGPWGTAGWYVHCHQEYHLTDGTAVDPEDYFSSTAGDGYTPIEEDDMFSDQDRADLKAALNQINNTHAGVWFGGSATIDGRAQKFNYGILPISVHTQTLVAQLIGKVNGLATALAQVSTGGIDVEVIEAIEAAAREGAESAAVLGEDDLKRIAAFVAADVIASLPDGQSVTVDEIADAFAQRLAS